MALMVVNIGGVAVSCWMTCKYPCSLHRKQGLTTRPDALSFVKSELAWRFPLAFQLFFVLVIFLTAFWLPESPRWLAMKHQDDKALAVMAALEGSSVTSESSTARRDFEEIQNSIALEESPRVKRETKARFRLVLGVAVQGTYFRSSYFLC